MQAKGFSDCYDLQANATNGVRDRLVMLWEISENSQASKKPNCFKS